VADAFAATLSRRGAPLEEATAHAAAEAAAATEGFLEATTPLEASAATQRREAACLHALDHLARLARRAGQRERAQATRRNRRLARMGRALAAALADPRDVERLERVHALMLRWRAPLRDGLLRDAADGRHSPSEAARRLDAQRWLQRSAYHFWRIAAHLHTARDG
jgi:phosphate:Na+ symporter